MAKCRVGFTRSAYSTKTLIGLYCWQGDSQPSGRSEFGCQKRTAVKHKGLMTFIGQPFK